LCTLLRACTVIFSSRYLVIWFLLFTRCWLLLVSCCLVGYVCWFVACYRLFWFTVVVVAVGCCVVTVVCCCGYVVAFGCGVCCTLLTTEVVYIMTLHCLVVLPVWIVRLVAVVGCCCYVGCGWLRLLPVDVTYALVVTFGLLVAHLVDLLPHGYVVWFGWLVYIATHCRFVGWLVCTR